jgi:hypothetical protein
MVVGEPRTGSPQSSESEVVMDGIEHRFQADDVVGPEILTEAGRGVLCWRLTQLKQVGYTDAAARLLATSGVVDLHQAIDLYQLGCPPETAIRILL